MAERLSRLIAAERVMAADLPHRLRTPLTALRMNVSSLIASWYEHTPTITVTN